MQEGPTSRRRSGSGRCGRHRPAVGRGGNAAQSLGSRVGMKTLQATGPQGRGSVLGRRRESRKGRGQTQAVQEAAGSEMRRRGARHVPLQAEAWGRQQRLPWPRERSREAQGQSQKRGQSDSPPSSRKQGRGQQATGPGPRQLPQSGVGEGPPQGHGLGGVHALRATASELPPGLRLRLPWGSPCSPWGSHPEPWDTQAACGGELDDHSTSLHH